MSTGAWDMLQGRKGVVGFRRLPSVTEVHKYWNIEVFMHLRFSVLSSDY